ncbi:MAG: hypothetical protein CMJ78_04690 [Planctomycetaceae bacterium]|nr:hypothetical protein [Planctomycetaceae bacterium]
MSPWRSRIFTVLILTASILTITATAKAGNWPQLRGPNFNGSTDETDLPTDWSRTKNIKWMVDLPGASAATPIVWDDYVFVSTTDDETDSIWTMAIKNGKIAWRYKVSDEIRQDSRSNYASPTPVTDGQTVIFFFGNGEMVAHGTQGQILWRRNIQKSYGPFAFLWTFSSSPVLYDGQLFLQVLQRDVPVSGRGRSDGKNESYLLAIDPETGSTIWRHVRPSNAKAESLESFGTPLPFEHNGRKELVVVGGDDITGHDVESGKELWRWGTWNPDRITHWRLVPSPVAGGGVILACAPKRSPIFAVKAGGKGQLSNDSIKWDTQESRDLTSDVPTPAFYDGDFFVLSDIRKRLARVDPKTGEIKWSMQTPGRVKYEASPLVADGKVYLINFVGTVVVVDAKDGKIINEISMDDPADDAVRSSVVAANGELYIRVNRKLYCVRE